MTIVVRIRAYWYRFCNTKIVVEPRCLRQIYLNCGTITSKPRIFLSQAPQTCTTFVLPWKHSCSRMRKRRRRRRLNSQRRFLTNWFQRIISSCRTRTRAMRKIWYIVEKCLTHSCRQKRFMRTSRVDFVCNKFYFTKTVILSNTSTCELLFDAVLPCTVPVFHLQRRCLLSECLTKSDQQVRLARIPYWKNPSSARAVPSNWTLIAASHGIVPQPGFSTTRTI